MENEQKAIYIGLLGMGTVGSGVIEVLNKNAEDISKRVGAPIKLKKILVRDKRKTRANVDTALLTDNFDDIINDSDISIIIEVIGGIKPAKDYIVRALNAGKSVVTANKDVMSTSGKEIFCAASENNVDIRFEASVGGGIPIIMPLKECLTANVITEVMGIVNGTTNYMLTKMTEDGADYNAVLKEAQKKGYAEANPAADVDGLDAARKAAILASLAFNTRIGFDDVSVEGITKISPTDIGYARELGYVIKLIAVGKNINGRIDVRVNPALLPTSHPLASVNGVYNAIFVRGNAIGEAMFYGPGAGSLPTASAVVADVITTARNILRGSLGNNYCTCYDNKPLCPVEDTKSSYYVRLLVDDEPGVLGTIATTFGESGVNLKSVMQTTREIKNHAEIVVITHLVEHRKILCAAEALKNLPVINVLKNIIRVENEENLNG
ncbi:MAG: homoserine dehydrogenase [Selenomonadaceae bacterium]|nr:homoserine dehydrogenase [Selenomonadaceae bacterium]